MPLYAGDPAYSGLLPGWVAESLRDTTVGTFTTTETLLQSITFNAHPAARYKFTALQSIQSSVAGDLIRVRMRYTTGTGPVLNTSTEIMSQLPNADIAGKGQVLPTIATITGLTGDITVGVFAVRESGTGNISSFGDARQKNLLMVERV
ncbi:hypothetical protein [Micromonospora tulbaghiae]|uniref:hypothetical protein n=1 Tax=Micromonospora tulbaghiae TaxID=479978 RepID=UPI0033EBA85A